MMDFDTNVRITEIQKCLEEVLSCVHELKEKNKSGEDMWDNSDLIRNWKISERTLASWRQKGLISHVKIKGKIWYPLKAREEFLQKNLKPIKYE